MPRLLPRYQSQLALSLPSLIMKPQPQASPWPQAPPRPPATALAPALANATAPVPTPNQFCWLGYARRGRGARTGPRRARTDYSRDVSEPPGHLTTLSFPLISLQHTPSLSSLYNTLWSNHFLEINLVESLRPRTRQPPRPTGT